MKNYKLTICLHSETDEGHSEEPVLEMVAKATSDEHADYLVNALAKLMTGENSSFDNNDFYFGHAEEEKKMTPLMTGEKEVNILGVVLSIPRTVRAVFVEEDGSVWATTMPASCQKTNEHEFMESLKFSGSIPTSVAKVINDYLLIEV